MNEFTPDQARTQDLERRGFHGAQVRSDGIRAVIELDHVTDVDQLLAGHVVSVVCEECGEEQRSLRSAG